MSWYKLERDILYRVSKKIMDTLSANDYYKVYCRLNVRFSEANNSFYGVMNINEDDWFKQIPISNQNDINKALKFLAESRKKNYKGKIVFDRVNILTQHIFKKGYRKAIINEAWNGLNWVVIDQQPGGFEAVARGPSLFTKAIQYNNLGGLKREIERGYFKNG